MRLLAFLGLKKKKEEQSPLANYCGECGEAYPTGTPESCEKCGARAPKEGDACSLHDPKEGPRHRTFSGTYCSTCGKKMGQ